MDLVIEGGIYQTMSDHCIVLLFTNTKFADVIKVVDKAKVVEVTPLGTIPQR